MIPGVNERAFDNMNYAASDKTAVNLTGDKAEVTSEDVHNMLMAAGFTPGLGNIADAADAILYAAEGEFGSAALSAAAMIPFIGQTVSAKRALKIAKESGEEMVKLYRGVEKWYPGKMVKEGKFVGSGEMSTRMTSEGPEKWFYTTTNLSEAKSYAGAKGFWADAKMTEWVEKDPTGVILEFDVPKSYVEKMGIDAYGNPLKTATAPQNKVNMHKGAWENKAVIFQEGLLKDFLTKVHK